MTALFVLACAVFLMALLTLAEAALAASRTARLEQYIKAGNRRARRTLRLVERPGRLVATVRLLVIAILVVAGAIAQLHFAEPLAKFLVRRGASTHWSGPASAALAVICVTVGAVFLGDYLPRRIAALAPETIAGFFARPLRIVAALAAPLVGLLEGIAGFLVRAIGLRPADEPVVTDEEIRELMNEGARTGVFEKAEQDIVTNVFRLGDRRASALMTPRTELRWIDITADQETISRTLSEFPHSHYPIAQGSLEHVLGVLSSKDCLSRAFAGQPIILTELLQRPLVVPESVSALQLLESFRESPQQVALIADEYGSMLGLVTQDDVLEAIVGDLPSPNSVESVPPATRREDGSWLVDASMPADEFNDLMDIDELPGQSEYDTIGGFVLMQLQRIPQVADTFVWKGMRFEVVDMDGKRIDKVLVSPKAESSSRPDTQAD